MPVEEGESKTRTTELLWTGMASLYGWRIYRQPWDGEVFIMSTGTRGHRAWAKIDLDKAPKVVRKMAASFVAKG